MDNSRVCSLFFVSALSFVSYTVGVGLLSTQPKCNYVVELFHLQDYSASFEDDLDELKLYFPTFLVDVNTTFPGSTYGVGSFVDKPLPPYGMPYEGSWFTGDWCLNVSIPVSAEDPFDVANTLTSGQIGAGFDVKENQIGALHDIARNAELAGWTDRVVNDMGLPVMRVITLTTDAKYHMAPDGETSSLKLTPNDGDGVTHCQTEGYPSVPQLRSALRDRNAYTIFLVGSDEVEVQQSYSDLITEMNVRGGSYKISDDSSDILTTMVDAFQDMAELVCTLPSLDIVFAHDVTWSYKNDLPLLKNRIEELTNNLAIEYVSPRFGLTTFGDKPMLPLGHLASKDYCYRLHRTLTFSRDELLAAAIGIKTTSGVDWKESQLDGLLSSVLEPTMGWRVGTHWNGFEMLRVVVLATDSGYHTSPDAMTAGYNLAVHSGGMVNCLGEEYPSWEQVAQVLVANDVHPLFVPTRDIAVIYRRLLKKLEDDYGIVGVVAELDDFGELKEVVPRGLRRLQAKIAKGNHNSDGHMVVE